MSRRAKIIWSIVAILVIMQFFRIDKTNPPVNDADDFVKIYNTPDSIQTMIKTSCYDCHSNETVYPSYSNIAPISWVVKSHINEGRENLNFSEFGKYNDNQKRHGLEEAAEEIEKGKMPMGQYTMIHKDAKLSESQKKVLIDYFTSIENSIGNENANTEMNEQHNEANENTNENSENAEESHSNDDD